MDMDSLGPLRLKVRALSCVSDRLEDARKEVLVGLQLLSLLFQLRMDLWDPCLETESKLL